MLKTKKLFIFGNTNHAVMMKEYFQEFSEYEVVGFVVDGEYIKDKILSGLPVIASELCMQQYPVDEYYAFVAIGYKDVNRLRYEKITWLKSLGYKLANYIDPSSSIFPTVRVGENCLIMEKAVIQPDVIVGDGVIVAASSVIGHNGILGEGSFIGAGAIISGFCEIGRGCFIGVNSTVANNVNIADYSVLGAGTHISKNTSKYGIYMSPEAKNVMKSFKDADRLEEVQKQLFNKSIGII